MAATLKEHNIITGDPVAPIISLNIRRRHLDPQQQLDLIVAARMAVNKPGHDGPVSKGGRGKVNPVKAAVMADAKAAGLDPSERTVKRAIAKAEGKVPAKPKRRSKAEILRRGPRASRPSASFATMPKYTARPMPKPKSGSRSSASRLLASITSTYAPSPGVDLDAEQEIIVDALREIASKRALNGASPKAEPRRCLQDGRSEDGSL